MRLADRPLLSAEDIAAKVEDLAGVISRDFGDGVVLLCVLKGALHFTSDLARALDVPCRIDFIRVKSYAGTASSGDVEILVEPDGPIEGEHIVIVEDILDTGITSEVLTDYVWERSPEKLGLCALMRKNRDVTPCMEADYVGFSIPDVFVVGYGLDYDERYRELPAVYELLD